MKETGRTSITVLNLKTNKWIIDNISGEGGVQDEQRAGQISYEKNGENVHATCVTADAIDLVSHMDDRQAANQSLG